MGCKFDFEIRAKEFYLLPSISFMCDNMVYAMPNFAIRFDWLALHARLLLLKSGVIR